jgi:DNA-binding NtrC family response regulator
LRFRRVSEVTARLERAAAGAVAPAAAAVAPGARAAAGARADAAEAAGAWHPPEHPALPPGARAELGDFTTRNAATAAVVRRLHGVADSGLALLILGESGTGKEFVANQLHALSPRARGPFVAVNCGALPRDLIESELFGHVPGAFTGAQRERKGAFLAASGGTLLLDEIGDAPLEVQVSLLRVLESGRVKPVGSDREGSVDVRVLSATSRDVQALIESGAFRLDLYYRVAQIAVRLPSLRERPEDVIDLAEHFLARERPGLVLADDAQAALLAYAFPGNVRELANAIKRAAALVGPTGEVHAEDLDLDAVTGRAARPSAPPAAAATPATQPGRPRFVFPRAVVELAQRGLAAGEIPRPEGLSRRESRAHVRAAFAYLKSEKPHAPWPASLHAQFERTFGPRWASAEEGRGRLDLLALLRVDVRDQDALTELEALFRRRMEV